MGSSTSAVVNEGLYYIAAFAFLLFFLIVFLMVLFTVRYRRSRNPTATEMPGKAWIEVLAFVLPTILALTMFAYGLTGFNFLRHAPEGSLRVAVQAKQWSWLFIYPNGKKSPDLVVPVGRDVRLAITSADVLHGFYVPDFRIQMDAVPGMETMAWFRATEEASHDVLCTLYCGVEHSTMLAKLYAVSPEQYETWYEGGSLELAGTTLSGGKPQGLDLLRERGCLSCHSIDGTRRTGPSFKGIFGKEVEVVTAGKQREAVVDADFIRSSILDPHADLVDGYADIMPSGKDSMDAEDIEEAIRAIEALK
jgi:cytochrome c oxidase subunit 2